MSQDVDLFQEYGANADPQLAIEELVTTFITAGIPAPIKIVLPKGGLSLLQIAVMRKTRKTEPQDTPAQTSTVIKSITQLGSVQITEE